MTYEQTIEYLFNCAPAYQQVGSSAYKEGLDNTLKLDKHFGHPHRNYRTIHIAGTNGKGSTSHTLAAILQSAGYKVGLYTSPHLIDFRERIRVNGVPVDKEFVIEFVEKEKEFFEPLHPSFFELTTAMAFQYFAMQKVDAAIVEVGLGGRLDCTNIISPDACIITNISLDHTQFLGSKLQDIAREKAGIMKVSTPAIIGETTAETKEVFVRQAEAVGAYLIFAEDEKPLISADPYGDGIKYETKQYGTIIGELGGEYQIKNTNTILTALQILQKLGFNINQESIGRGFANVTHLTGLMGRWQKIGDSPKTVCDAGHNIGGISYIVNQLKRQQYKQLRIIFGMVNDKDVSGVLSLMPKDAIYYFTQAGIKRALPSKELASLATTFGLQGRDYATVSAALEAARNDADTEDFIFIGGSCFIVADLLYSIS